MKARELKAGDWFECDGKRYLCVDPRLTESSDVVCWNGHSIHFRPGCTVKPLPDCTGWDWEPEPEAIFRNEYEQCAGPWHECSSKCDGYHKSGRIGYTIRRTWPDGRIEQEFVQEDAK